jgi:hypothetical protein
MQNKAVRFFAWFASCWLFLWAALGMFASDLTWARFSFACEMYLAIFTIVTLRRTRKSKG